MAGSLKDRMMAKIRFDQHYDQLNGEANCAVIRWDAAARLPEAIRTSIAEGEKIAPPDEKLIAAVKRVAQVGDVGVTQLTNTWKAASRAIDAHIEAATIEAPKARQEMLDEVTKEILNGPSKKREWTNRASDNDTLNRRR